MEFAEWNSYRHVTQWKSFQQVLVAFETLCKWRRSNQRVVSQKRFWARSHQYNKRTVQLVPARTWHRRSKCVLSRQCSGILPQLFDGFGGSAFVEQMSFTLMQKVHSAPAPNRSAKRS